MGNCFARDEYVHGLHGVPAEEEWCYASECLLGLNKVTFTTFQGAIKRFGYRVDLNADHLKSIAPEIALNLESMKKAARGAHNIYYNDTAVIFKDEKYQVDKLMTMGWLLCRHSDLHE